MARQGVETFRVATILLPVPWLESNMARQGVETFRFATILLPVPWLQTVQCRFSEVTFLDFELSELDVWILWSSQAHQPLLREGQ